MSFISFLISFVLDALFPLSPAEKEVLAVEPGKIFQVLPRAKASPVPEACSIFTYKDERVRKLIWSIKYKKSPKAVILAGQALYRVLNDFSRAVRPIIVIPMPITKKRRRERGFNQCELLTNQIEKLDLDKRLIVARNVLLRKVHISRQTLKDRRERLESVKDIFWADSEAVKKLNLDLAKNYLVIVIDDVVTTGSTILEAIQTLRKAGLEKTFGLSVAH
ncbi:MAG: hypothetical protein WCT02_03830 [Candidatus Paceibacterota bacterium]